MNYGREKNQKKLVAGKAGLFAYMQREFTRRGEFTYLSTFVRDNFVSLRLHAEKMARFNCNLVGQMSPSIEQVYAALRLTGEISEKECYDLQAFEKQAANELGVPYISMDDFVADLSLVEQYVISRGREDLVRHMLIGASSLARECGDLSGPEDIGASVGGPVLMPYVQWLLQRSVSLGINRLYFIARDGYILKCIADILIECLHLPIKTYYIYGSRRAWRMPSYEGRAGELRELIGWSQGEKRSICSLAEIMQIDQAWLEQYVPLVYRGKKGSNLSSFDLNACVYSLDKNEEFRKALRDKMLPRRKIVQAYLQQEIDFSDDRYAFVELGGGGLTQICLGKLITEFCSHVIKTFYYKLDRVRNPSSQGIFYDFFPNRRKHSLILEMICRAPEGQTEEYKQVSGTIIPVKKSGEKERYLQHGYDKYIAGIKAFATIYAESIKIFHLGINIAAIADYMDFIFTAEGNDILNFFAETPNSVSGREKLVPDYAPPLDKQSARNIFLLHTDDEAERYYRGTDLELSIKRSPTIIQRKVQFYRRNRHAICDRWQRFFSRQKVERWTDGRLQVLPMKLYGKRVVLYGGGIRGSRIYKYLQDEHVAEVVQWLDKDWVNLQSDLGLPVSGDINDLGKIPFDVILISIGNQKLCEQIKMDMLGKDIQEQFILELPKLDSLYLDISKYLVV